MKFINKKLSFALGLFLGCVAFTQAQQTPPKKKIDGVIGVVGNYVILESEIDKTLEELKAQGAPMEGFSRCQLFGKLLEDKLFAHHAIQDSLEVADSEVNSFMDQQIESMVEYAGSMKNVLTFYNKKNVEEFREYFFDIVKSNKLTQKMQQHIVEKVEITPEEVRQFFNAIPKSELPTIGDEVEIAEIVVKPVISKEQKQKVIDQLKDMKRDIIENGASFFSKAVLFSDDKASVPNGGFYSISKKDPFAKEFKDMAYTMAEGEISEPFETDFGYHIIYLEKIRGQQLDLRHILLIPKATEEAIEQAHVKIEGIREKIVKGEISFSDAAAASSDDKETRNNGGVLRDPMSQDPLFELNKMEDRELYALVANLKVGEVSKSAYKTDRKGDRAYRIVTVNSRKPEHQVDFAEDYTKVKNMALNDKQGKEIAKWIGTKIDETYVNIQGEYRKCTFKNNWIKK
ncbi:peptidylprolyl isomerase [Flavobacterium sp. JP2137]|uniref:peptidylprolyl isomerase n=1 Tax=Flavobacterium sp. JP2137 TaxID=3414510 RepID=UPI003D2FF814